MSIHPDLLALISLEGRTSVISGAASGIGRGIARKLAEAGSAVALLDIDAQKGNKAKDEILSLGVKAEFYRCDVSLVSDCRETIEEIVKEFKSIDILVNNAGAILRKSVVDLDEEDWDFLLSLNLKPVYILSHYVIPHMVKKGGGSIVNIGSGWGLKGGPKAAAYCASKGAVVNLTRAMAIDRGGDNIRVNCVCPGDVKTALLQKEAGQIKMDFEKFLIEASRRPIPRVGMPEDVANAVLFLACSLSDWVTGSVFVVDGGGLA
jgi:NAD(P)-dependent dehydrogenase (short-subunit alcohol dehydrogenase family)